MPQRLQVAFVRGGGCAEVIADIDEEGAQRVAGSLPDATAVRVDTSDAGSVERCIAAAVERYDRIDVVFNNAGISGEQLLIHEMSVENWNRVTRINGDGVFYVLKFGIAAMLRNGGGAIVNTSSTNGLIGIPNIAPYTFTKWSVIGLTKSTAIEYAKQGIRVNAIAPTVVRTPLVEKFIADATLHHGARDTDRRRVHGAVVADAALTDRSPRLPVAT